MPTPASLQMLNHTGPLKVEHTHCRVCNQTHDIQFHEAHGLGLSPGFWEVKCTNPGCPLGATGCKFDDREYGKLDLSSHVWYAQHFPQKIAEANGHAG